jgi:phosphate starvation-inducible protein PhoH and related proteins
MIEKKISVDTEMPVDFLGVQNENLKLIQKLFPKLIISHRGDEIMLKGDEAEIAHFMAFYDSVNEHLGKYKLLRPEDINNIFYERLPTGNKSDVVIYGNHGKIIRPRTKGQERLIEAFGKDDLLFATGPAGTGKTYMAIALAVKALKEKQVQRIILSRPAVEAGESLGFLPGDVKMKLDPYLQALYDALYDLIPGRKLNTLIENGTVQIAPLAYMRGRTLNNAVVILDEAQNTTLGQIKMFLTRMGENSKFFVTGDITQIDLPDKSASGLVKAKHLLNNIEGISFIEFSKDEIIRHRLVTSIVNAFEKGDTN